MPMPSPIDVIATRSNGGFTLIELLVVLALFGLVASLAVNATRFGLTAWDRSRSAVGEGDRMARTQTLLRDLIERAYPFDIGRATTRLVHPFDGAADAMIWTAPLEADPRLDILYRIALWRDGSKLKLAFTPDRNDVADPRQVTAHEHTVLLDDVGAVSFAYYEAAVAGGPGRWVPLWHNNERLPQAVRLDVTLDDPADAWPRLVAAPRLTASSHCDFDPVSRTCR